VAERRGMNEIQPFRNLDRVYCAGPLFNEAERSEMLRIAAALEKEGFQTFVPHADGLEFAEVLPWLVQRGMDAQRAGMVLHQAIFALDTYQVVCGCGSLVMNYNGRVPDEGAVAECTMAWMLGKPVVIYKEDVRSLIAGRDNPLVAGQTGFEMVERMDRIGEALRTRIQRDHPSPDTTIACPPPLARTLALGQAFWERIVPLGTERPVELVGRAVLEVLDTAADPGRPGLETPKPSA